jgi:hypothetical protein
MEYNNRLFLVHEGQLRPEIEDSLKQELSPRAYDKAVKRIPSINLLIRIIDKLSRVYSEPVARTASTTSDQKLIEFYEREASVDKVMTSANKIANLHKCAALEPFVQDGKPYLRVLPAHQFLVYSDDLVNPLRPTVFIKFMGKDRNVPFTDRDGRKTEYDEVRTVQLYYLYSDTEFAIVDSEGAYRDDRMSQRGLVGVNPLGRLPFVYVNRSDFRLVPLPDTDTLDNTVLIPKLLADLNYAVQFQSHTVFVALDADVPSDLAISPDTVWNIKSSEGDKQGRIDTVKPSVDIQQVIELIKVTLSMWLESRNIRAGDMGQVSPGDAASGVARIIDESDATQDRQSQCAVFSVAERQLWALLRDMHNYWVETGQIESSDTWTPSTAVSTRFGDQKPVVTDRERLEVVGMKLDKGLISRRQAVKEIYPHWTDAEVELHMKGLDDEPTEPTRRPSQEGGGPANEGGSGPVHSGDDTGPSTPGGQGG